VIHVRIQPPIRWVGQYPDISISKVFSTFSTRCYPHILMYMYSLFPYSSESINQSINLQYETDVGRTQGINDRCRSENGHGQPQEAILRLPVTIQKSRRSATGQPKTRTPQGGGQGSLGVSDQKGVGYRQRGSSVWEMEPTRTTYLGKRVSVVDG